MIRHPRGFPVDDTDSHTHREKVGIGEEVSGGVEGGRVTVLWRSGTEMQIVNERGGTAAVICHVYAGLRRWVLITFKRGRGGAVSFNRGNASVSSHLRYCIDRKA